MGNVSSYQKFELEVFVTSAANGKAAVAYKKGQGNSPSWVTLTEADNSLKVDFKNNPKEPGLLIRMNLKSPDYDFVPNPVAKQGHRWVNKVNGQEAPDGKIPTAEVIKDNTQQIRFVINATAGTGTVTYKHSFSIVDKNGNYFRVDPDIQIDD